MSRVAVIDYGLGNLLSVEQAIRHCGADVVCTSSPELIGTADFLVLPGVGAFADGMKGLELRGLLKPLLFAAESGKPILGICLGMQLLFESSSEFGLHTGLGLIPGAVTEIPSLCQDGSRRRIPHIGWTAIMPPENRCKWEDPLLDGLPSGVSMYFVHSFMAKPADEKQLKAVSNHDGVEVAAVVRRGNLSGCQFHPEKSGPAGLKLFKNFLRLG